MESVASFFMNYTILLSVIILLLCVILSLLFSTKRKFKSYDEWVKDLEAEAVEGLSKVEKNHQNEKEKLVKKMQSEYEMKINDFKEYVDSAEIISKHASEVNRQKLLYEVKKRCDKTFANNS
ncbi:hypothetical protein E2R51_14620 [Jeotgalibacillus sp. S-D1]|uniref:hypothetical protein n=1 Tax=Jeotgalibacillus sp. S-D1 TaxID=2552189 RepID=UPI00105A336B|nr:hypothetical protein [Jeotgalibacillus sp. S-D1]TDL31031.1 hypothetical protein E2R51_14620 [Jeotgalibacillus sp. S-D1]